MRVDTVVKFPSIIKYPSPGTTKSVWAGAWVEHHSPASTTPCIYFACQDWDMMANFPESLVDQIYNYLKDQQLK